LKNRDVGRTILFAIGAIACLAITGAIEYGSRPAPIKEFGKVGQEFYPDFTDPTLATSLEVYAFDADTVRPLDFRVQRLDSGRWVIPSHHNYPADAEEQLAKTAASVIGINRGAMATRWKADHGRFGVVNPKQETLGVDEVEGVGKRVILRGDGDSLLADYIIGHKLEGESDQFYVRHPDEEEVYIAKLDIELSTKFSDWVDTDLLELDSWDITEVTINDYSLDELKGQITNRDVSTFRRESSSDPWELDGLNDETEEVDTDAMRETINALADLQIVGVRPKPQGLTAELKLDRSALKSQRDVDRLQADLLSRGFLLQPGEDGNEENLRLISREGELYAATDEGLVYRLHFGRAFTGTEEELEIGISATNGQESDETTAEEPAKSDEDDGSPDDAVHGNEETLVDNESESDASEPAGEDAEETNSSRKPGRYVFVRVEFDKKYLGEEPSEPVEPEMPDELKAAEKENDQDSRNGNGPEATDPDAGTPDAEPEEDTASTGKKEADDPLAEVREQYEAAKKDYEDGLREFEEFQQKVEQGQNSARELNDRFAAWYYVIPGDSFEKLRLSRGDLVKMKEQEKDGEEESDAE
jgi:hypothetical protein